MSKQRRGVIASELFTPPPTVPILGFYTGSNTVAAITSLASSLSVTAKGYSIFADGSSWSSISSWTPGGSGFGTPPAGATLCLGLPICPSGSDLTSVAGHISSFQTLAHNLPDHTIIRLGWEFDGVGFGFAWSPGGANTPSAYASAYASVAAAMKAINPTFMFDWCCNTGSSNLAALMTYYPGDSAVDLIGGDHYDFASGASGDFSLFAPPISMCVSHGKPLSCGEWGLHSREDPTFITNMAQGFLDPAAAVARYSFAGLYTVFYHSYFSDDLSGSGGINSDITDFPTSAAQYTTEF